MSRTSKVSWLVSGILLATAAACNFPTLVAPTASAIKPPATLPPVTAPAATALPTTALPATATLTPTAIVHLTTPADPPAAFISQIQDINSSSVAAQRRAPGGENYAFNLFERPFNQDMSLYYPYLDITHAGLSRDATWLYGTITLVGQTTHGGLPGLYALEIDVNRDGRGDFLIMARAPSVSWSTDGVQVWQDSDHDVGGIHPVEADTPPQTGNGYETLLFDQGQGNDSDLAWERISPNDPKSVQIAFKRSPFNDANPYLWGAWAMDPAMIHPDWFDYNDHFTQAEAGSPLVELTQYYPLKALYEIDNTCRWAVGFTPTGTEPGICPLPPTPTPKPSPTPSPTPTMTWTQKLQ